MGVAHYLCPLLALLGSACMAPGNGGAWPSLAHRPGERIAPGPCNLRADAAVPAPEVTEPLYTPPVMAADMPISDAELAELDSELGRIIADWDRQAASAEAAVESAQSASPSSTLWGAAQIELSRLEAVYGRSAPLDVRLARAEQPLVTDAGPLGEAIERYEAFRRRHLSTYDGLRQRLTGAPPASEEGRAEAANRAGAKGQHEVTRVAARPTDCKIAA
ncbi:hypothetical protein ACSMXM_12780 [Pacificimonas sp. ICDLI1SI03]